MKDGQPSDMMDYIKRLIRKHYKQIHAHQLHYLDKYIQIPQNTQMAKVHSRRNE